MQSAASVWYFVAICGALAGALESRGGPSRGRLLIQRHAQAPQPAAGVTEDAASHIFTNIQTLKQEAVHAVTKESSLITSVALRKEQQGRDIIEKEIPLAAQNDTQEVSKDMAEHQQILEDAMSRSIGQAKEALEDLQDKTSAAVNISTAYKVREVEKEAEVSAMMISNHSIELQAEAAALAREAKGAANFSEEAAKNSKLWVKELPVQEAADAVKTARRSEQHSIQLRHEYEDTKRMAKLAGNLALDTLRISAEAAAKSEKAKQEATETAEQAAQNALLLNTIRSETKKAAQAAMTKLSG